MNRELTQLIVTMEQMERLIRALGDLKANVLPQNPALFATMAEGPLEDLERLRTDLRARIDDLQPTA